MTHRIVIGGTHRAGRASNDKTFTCRGKHKTYRSLAILSSNHRDKIMQLDMWQIIRVKVTFISASRDFRGGPAGD